MQSLKIGHWFHMLGELFIPVNNRDGDIEGVIQLHTLFVLTFVKDVPKEIDWHDISSNSYLKSESML